MRAKKRTPHHAALVGMLLLSACGGGSGADQPSGAAGPPATTASAAAGGPAVAAGPAGEVPCARLLTPDEVELLLGVAPTSHNETAYPGGTTCVWQYTPSGGVQQQFLQVQMSWSDYAVQLWTDMRESELRNEASGLAVSGIDGLGDESHAWVSNASDTRVIYTRRGGRTLVLRYATDVASLRTESGIIDFVDRLYGRL